MGGISPGTSSRSTLDIKRIGDHIKRVFFKRTFDVVMRKFKGELFQLFTFQIEPFLDFLKFKRDYKESRVPPYALVSDSLAARV